MQPLMPAFSAHYGISAATRSSAIGWGDAPARPRRGPRRWICSRITSAPAWPAPVAGCKGMRIGEDRMSTHTPPLESALLLYVPDVAISTVSMWLAAEVTALHAMFFQIGMAMPGAALVGLLPGLRGWLLSIAARFWLLRHFTEASMYPDILLMVVVSRMIWALIIFGFL
ncbi:MAG: hypothetical protein ACYCUX_10395 [Metallibacterium sp.]